MHRDINRYKTKSLYQRNMLLAWPIIIIIFIVPTWIYSKFSITSEDNQHTSFTNIRVVDPKLSTTMQSKPTKRNIGSRVNSSTGFNGQFGVKFSIIPDNPISPKPILEIPKVYTLDSTSIFIDHNFSISEIDTGEIGEYVPRDADYDFELILDSDTTSTLLTRGPELIYRIKPKIPPLAKDMGIGGVVEVLILIDPVGNHANFAVHAVDSNFTSPEFFLEVTLKDGKKATLEFYVDQQKNDLLYVTLKDEPSEFKFAKYFHDVLPQWHFSPAIKEGEPVYSFVYITYNFCSSKEEECMELILSSS